MTKIPKKRLLGRIYQSMTIDGAGKRDSKIMTEISDDIWFSHFCVNKLTFLSTLYRKSCSSETIGTPERSTGFLEVSISTVPLRILISWSKWCTKRLYGVIINNIGVGFAHPLVFCCVLLFALSRLGGGLRFCERWFCWGQLVGHTPATSLIAYLELDFWSLSWHRCLLTAF